MKPCPDCGEPNGKERAGLCESCRVERRMVTKLRYQVKRLIGDDPPPVLFPEALRLVAQWAVHDCPGPCDCKNCAVIEFCDKCYEAQNVS